ncbi:MAG TPA: zinc-binding dehydrogenase, partial [Mycobacteriales bacterium]|nr:zinc-binding dehydrogenase [Mycobacteriales bacterium]
MGTTGDMVAAYVTGLGPPEAIRYGRLPVPAPGPTDVLVRVEVVAVNPVDTFVRSGAYRTPVPFPFVVGRDLVGTVAAADEGAAGFAPGQRVWANSLGHGGRQGPSAGYAVVAADRLYRLPDGADPVPAVACLHPVATAYLGLFEHAGLRAGQTVYIGGGAGNVGAAAVALAAGAGARVLASARPADTERCRAAGAHVVFDYADADLAARIGAAAPDGVEVWWDTSGHHDLDAAVPVLAPRGRVVLAAGLSARPVLPVGAVYIRDVRLVGFAISNATVA